ncbi:MAG: hypothetical protein PWQ57_2625 [Desulfovibrionales bacterium]|jgi:uncharacterized protein with HEPN domain|nr:hypothetical protein [Desulfovibrionales bacterium]
MTRESAVYHLDQILEAVQSIDKYTHGVSKEEFLENPEKQDSVCLRLLVIGECAYHLRNEFSFEDKHPEIDWRGMAALRHIIAHDYQIIDMERVWAVVQNRLPELKAFVQRMV